MAARATFGDTLGTAVDVMGPLFARGVIVRRPRVVNLIDKLGPDSRAAGDPMPALLSPFRLRFACASNPSG